MNDEEERKYEQVVTERDEAEDAMSQAYFLITGRSPEWSSSFGFDDALEEIKNAQECMRKSLLSIDRALREYPLLVSALDETMMKNNLLGCFNGTITAFRVSTDHYRYLAEQVIALREHIKRADTNKSLGRLTDTNNGCRIHGGDGLPAMCRICHPNVVL